MDAAKIVPVEIRDFLDTRMGLSPKSRENYESFARVFWGFIGPKKPADITVEDIMRFLRDGLSNKKWEVSTVRQYATVAFRFFNELRDESFAKLFRKQMKTLPRFQQKAGLYEGIYVPPENIDPFIAAAPNEEWAVFYTMVLKWGLRLNEALQMRPVDIDAKRNRVIVRGKGIGGFNKIRTVLVEKSTITRVLAFAGCTQAQVLGEKPIRESDPIIRRIKERRAEYQWKKTARKVGLKHWRKLTVHDGRHSYAIDFLIKRKKEGMAALVLLKNQMGHTNINTTMIYLDIAGVEAQEVFDAGLEQSKTIST